MAIILSFSEWIPLNDNCLQPIVSHFSGFVEISPPCLRILPEREKDHFRSPTRAASLACQLVKPPVPALVSHTRVCVCMCACVRVCAASVCVCVLAVSVCGLLPFNPHGCSSAMKVVWLVTQPRLPCGFQGSHAIRVFSNYCIKFIVCAECADRTFHGMIFKKKEGRSSSVLF